MGRVPALRFPEFSGEWREIRLGDIGKVSMCKRILKSQTSAVGEIPFYKIGTFGKIPDAFIEKSLFEEYKSQYSFPKKGDILISAAGTIGRTVVYDGKPAYFQDSNIVWIANDEKNVLNRFLKYCYQQINWLTEDTTIARLYNENLRRIKLNIPSLPEQQKIADFLSAVDEKIAILTDKITRLEAYKKGMIQKLLSGELRFPGFTDAWREVKLGEISTISTGTSKSKFIQDKGKYFIIDMGSISSDGKLIVSKRTDHNSDFLKEGILVMPKDDIGGGNIIGKTAYVDVDNKYIMGDHIYKIETIQDNSRFIHYLINSYKVNKILRRRATGTAQLGLNKNSVSTVPLKLPSLPEQQKIANFLTAIDDKLTLEKERLEELKRYKQGLLQKMFV